MRFSAQVLSGAFAVAVAAAMLWMAPASHAQNASFHNAPAAAATVKNPFEGQAQAAAAGKKLYGQNCSQCHGNNLQGMGPAPALSRLRRGVAGAASDEYEPRRAGNVFQKPASIRPHYFSLIGSSPSRCAS